MAYQQQQQQQQAPYQQYDAQYAQPGAYAAAPPSGYGAAPAQGIYPQATDPYAPQQPAPYAPAPYSPQQGFAPPPAQSYGAYPPPQQQYPAAQYPAAQPQYPPQQQGYAPMYASPPPQQQQPQTINVVVEQQHSPAPQQQAPPPQPQQQVIQAPWWTLHLSGSLFSQLMKIAGQPALMLSCNGQVFHETPVCANMKHKPSWPAVHFQADENAVITFQLIFKTNGRSTVANVISVATAPLSHLRGGQVIVFKRKGTFGKSAPCARITPRLIPGGGAAPVVHQHVLTTHVVHKKSKGTFI